LTRGALIGGASGGGALGSGSSCGSCSVSIATGPSESAATRVEGARVSEPEGAANRPRPPRLAPSIGGLGQPAASRERVRLVAVRLVAVRANQMVECTRLCNWSTCSRAAQAAGTVYSSTQIVGEHDTLLASRLARRRCPSRGTSTAGT
jgi:hypothetical protein